MRACVIATVAGVLSSSASTASAALGSGSVQSRLHSRAGSAASALTSSLTVDQEGDVHAAKRDTSATGLMRREAKEESQRTGASTVQPVAQECHQQPCCAADGCVFPFTYEGVTYTSCTSDFVDVTRWSLAKPQMWCGKESLMTNQSRWAWCIQGPCEQQGSSTGTDESLGTKPIEGLPPVAENFTISINRTAAETAAPNGSSIVVPAKAVTCEAPAGIENAPGMTCAEGKTIPAGGWCTPVCLNGKTPVIRLGGVTANDACPHPEANWGAKLCCNAGVMEPRSAFECIDDVYDKMDTNQDGVVSRREYEAFNRGTPSKGVSPKLAAAEEKAVDIMEDAKLQAQSISQSGSNPQAVEEGDPFVWYYLLFVTLFLVGAATFAVIWLSYNHSKNATWSIRDYAPSMPSFGSRSAQGPAVLTVAGVAAAEGSYSLVSDQIANGRPLWRSEEGPRFIFCSTSGKWAVGGSTEADAGFQVETGLLRSKVASSLPHEVGDGAGKWEVFDGSAWVDDADVKIIAAA